MIKPDDLLRLETLAKAVKESGNTIEISGDVCLELITRLRKAESAVEFYEKMHRPSPMAEPMFSKDFKW